MQASAVEADATCKASASLPQVPYQVLTRRVVGVSLGAYLCSILLMGAGEALLRALGSHVPHKHHRDATKTCRRAGASGFGCRAPLDVFTALTCLSGITNQLPALPPGLQTLQWHGNQWGCAPMRLTDLKVKSVSH